MKTKTIENGKIKVWFDKEEEFTIVGKNEPLIDTLIDANLLQKKYSKMLVEEIRKAGLDDFHGVFIDINDSLDTQLDRMNINELDLIFDSFNSVFPTKFKYHINSNGLVSLIFANFDDYQEFKNNYFGTFFLKLYAFKIYIGKTEEKNKTIKGLPDFLSKFAYEYLRKYLEVSREKKFSGVIRVK
jgi:hypothetical protein